MVSGDLNLRIAVMDWRDVPPEDEALRDRIMRNIRSAVERAAHDIADGQDVVVKVRFDAD